MLEQTGLKLNQQISTCTDSQNDTVKACPINLSENREQNEFVVIVHNQASKANKQYAKIKLPTNNYRAKIWKNGGFEDVPQDMFEQIHFNSTHDKFSDYELIVYAEMQPNEIGYLQIEKSEQPSQALLQKKSSQDTKLEIEGYNAKGEVMFRYKNKAQNIS